MTIRKKLAIWYSLFLLLLMFIFTIIIFFTVRNFMYSDSESTMKANGVKVDDMVVVNEDGKLALDSSKITSATKYYFAIFDAKGEIVFDNTYWDHISSAPPSFNRSTIVKIHHEEWILLDTYIKRNNIILGKIRMVTSTSQIEHTLENISILFLIATPLYIAIAVLGSLLIAKAALKPINEITLTAEEISKLDLSRRIEDVKTNDEVGRLSYTFNKMLERLEVAFLREKQFSADASHELRTPLTVIRAQAEDALYSEKSKEEYIKSLNQIAAESKKMGKIISQLLALSKGYDNKFIVNKERFDLTDVVQVITSELQEFANNFGVTIQNTPSDKIIMNADHRLITQMLINLITNSCKYGKIGGWVSIETCVKHDRIYIAITDNGIGISEEDIPHIFDRFFRADKSHSGDGTGLGLSIVKWIVEAHGGEINVTSKLHQGTKIEISFQP